VTEKSIVTTGTVKGAIERYIAERNNHFTTADIARFMGSDEYQVRAAFTWLARYRVVEIIPGVRSTRYLGEPRDPSKRRHARSYTASMYRMVEKMEAPDFAGLMGVLCRG